MRILVVEDDFVSRRALQKFLSPYGEADLAADGKEGIVAYELAYSSGQPYELICLDVMMPELSGHEVLAHIRKFEEDHGHGGQDRAKVIMTTALSDSKSVLGAFRTGCEAYLVKPISREKLAEKLISLELTISSVE